MYIDVISNELIYLMKQYYNITSQLLAHISTKIEY